MPVLSIKYGLSNVSFLALKEDKSTDYFSFKYPYSNNLYSNAISEADYYSEVTEFVLKKFKLTKKSLSVIATGLNQPPTISHNYIFTQLQQTLLKDCEKYEPILVDFHSIFTQNESIVMGINDTMDFTTRLEDTDYLYNSFIYPNLSPTTLQSYDLLFGNLFKMNKQLKPADSHHHLLASKPIFMFGPDFNTQDAEYAANTYISILSLIDQPGVYNVLFDPTDKFIHYLLLKNMDQANNGLYMEFTPNNLGTLINCPGETSCLIETKVGTKQLIDIPEDKIFVLPAEPDYSYRVLLKNHTLGDYDRYVSGGKIGLIFDTRIKSKDKNFDYNKVLMDNKEYSNIFKEIVLRL